MCVGNWFHRSVRLMFGDIMKLNNNVTNFLTSFYQNKNINDAAHPVRSRSSKLRVDVLLRKLCAKYDTKTCSAVM
jgi:hypothetical protein